MAFAEIEESAQNRSSGSTSATDLLEPPTKARHRRKPPVKCTLEGCLDHFLVGDRAEIQQGPAAFRKGDGLY